MTEPGSEDEEKLLPARIAQPLMDKVATAGDNVELKVGVHGTPLPKVEWYFNGNELQPGERHKFEAKDNAHKLKILNVSSSDGGKYTVEVHNRVGRDLVKATLTVRGMLCYSADI